MRREFGARLSQTRMSDEDNILRWGLPELSLEGVDRLVPTLDLLVCLDGSLFRLRVLWSESRGNADQLRVDVYYR